MVVVHRNGGGGDCFRRGLTRVVVGSDERGGVLRPLREWKGRQEAACARMQGGGGGYGHRSGEEDDWAGPACQREGVGTGKAA
jgi:hypothetical protein